MENGKSAWAINNTSRFFLLAQLGSLLSLFSCHNSDSVSIPNTISVDSSIVSTSDIVFRRGRGVLANMVLAQGDSSYFSHVGILLKTREGLSVIHAIPPDLNNEGIVLIEPLSDFFSYKNASVGSIYRLKGISSKAAKIMADYALKKVGRPFDNNFQYSEDSSYYCTELVLKSITAAKKDIRSKIHSTKILTIEEPVILPDDLRLSNQLEKILDIDFAKK